MNSESAVSSRPRGEADHSEVDGPTYGWVIFAAVMVTLARTMNLLLRG